MTLAVEQGTTADYRVTFPRVVRSEWTKMWSLRSNQIVLIGVPVVLFALAALIGYNNRGQQVSPTQVVGGGYLLSAMAIGVFGVLMMTGEFSSGLIRSSLLAVPKRLPVLGAKALVLIAATGPVMIAVYFGSFFTYEAFATPETAISISDPDIVRALFGVSGATVASGLIGLAIGTLLRTPPASIFTFVVSLIVLPQALLGMLPESAQDDALPFVPTLALQALFQVGSDAARVSPAKGAISVVAWVILLLAAAATTLHRRDP